jgi:cobalt-precorrin 5A hydrolase/precorrin-3B C17-methyltransferase
VSHPPRDLVVGLGCRPGVHPDDVRAVLDELLRRHALHPAGVLAYVTLTARVGEPGLRAVAGDALLCFPATTLASVAVPNPSRRVAASVGTPAVAEAAALHAAAELAPPGASVELIGPKLAGAGVTAAVVRIRP